MRRISRVSGKYGPQMFFPVEITQRAAHPVSLFQELYYAVRANETGSTGDQYGFGMVIKHLVFLLVVGPSNHFTVQIYVS